MVPVSLIARVITDYCCHGDAHDAGERDDDVDDDVVLVDEDHDGMATAAAVSTDLALIPSLAVNRGFCLMLAMALLMTASILLVTACVRRVRDGLSRTISGPSAGPW